MKWFFVFAFLAVLGLGGHIGHAQQFNLPDPGLTPESPVYFLDIWSENLRLFFVRSDSSRLSHYTSNLNERLAETEILAGRGVSANQKSLEHYRDLLPLLYATAEHLGDTMFLVDALRMATDHLDVLDNVSERTDFEKKRFILSTKKFIIDQQLQTLQFLAEREPEDALRIFGDALQRRMERVREVAIDEENNEEALDEYAAYMSETDSILREWDTSPVYLAGVVRGHEEILLGPVRDRLSSILEGELFFVVNSVRKLLGKELLLALPPIANTQEESEAEKLKDIAPDAGIPNVPTDDQGDIVPPPPPLL